MAEFLTKAALASELNILEHMGLTEEILTKIKEWGQTRSVTLRFKAEEKCTFDKKVVKMLSSDTEHVTTYEGGGAGFSVAHKKIKKHKEYHWDFGAEYELFAYKGNDPEEKLVFQSRGGKVKLITLSKDSPRDKVVVRPSIDLK